MKIHKQNALFASVGFLLGAVLTYLVTSAGDSGRTSSPAAITPGVGIAFAAPQSIVIQPLEIQLPMQRLPEIDVETGAIIPPRSTDLIDFQHRVDGVLFETNL